MATISVGNIKFNWKGPWSNSTTYAVDDVVSHSGSSYISIQAGSNQNPASASAYWQQMSSAGTNGTDLTTTLTTQGDILYRDGSGLQRLAAGTSGQFLKTQGSGANPVWGSVSTPLVKRTVYFNNTRYAYSDSSNTGAIFTTNFVKVHDNSTSAIDVTWMAVHYQNSSDYSGIYLDITTANADHENNDSSAFWGMGHNDDGQQNTHHAHKRFDRTDLDAGTHTIEYGYRSKSGSGNRPGTSLNPNSSDDVRTHQKGFYMFIDEMLK
jgi:hypothetical protein|tara:strand:- start:467 stop:1264 length:798 start_codon:yes stop_codon:yes gene_type:complete